MVRKLEERGCSEIVTRRHSELDLTDQAAVRSFFAEEKIDQVVLAAAKVGGIHANNTYPADFIYINTMIQGNVIHEAWKAGVRQLLFLGSSCIYPKAAPQPMAEKHLLTGLLEPTNEPYAIAKIAGIKMCESYNRQYGTNFRAVMPTNLYGPGDNYHLENSHVIPAMLRKFHLARLAQERDSRGIQADEQCYGKIPDDIAAAIGWLPEQERLQDGVEATVVLWGSGTPCREFLHVDDMAEACLYVMGLDQNCFQPPNPSFVNVGAGKDITIREVAELIQNLIGFTGKTVFNPEQPDGTIKKLLDTSRLSELGWKPKMSLRDGLLDAYRAYLNEM